MSLRLLSTFVVILAVGGFFYATTTLNQKTETEFIEPGVFDGMKKAEIATSDTEPLIVPITQQETPTEPSAEAQPQAPVKELNPPTREPEPRQVETYHKEKSPISNYNRPNEFRLEIPTLSERATLPECSDPLFATYPVEINQVSSITPIGNLGPPGHTFPTDHPHLHMGQHGSDRPFNIYSPADVYLTSVSWDDGMSQDPRDYTVYFAVCNDVVGYYNHIKTISPELQTIVDSKECENFSSGSSGCTKVLDLDKFENGKLMGTVGLKQGNWDFGLIDLRVDLNFIKPNRYPERSRHIQCAFDYYPQGMKQSLYSLINRDDSTCGTTMQDIPNTLQGNWFHKSAADNQEVSWDMYLAFVGDYEFSGVQVVSVAGIFTNPSKFEFVPKDTGNINRNFSHVTPGETYCYQTEDVGKYQRGAKGKIVVQMTDKETLQIEHQPGGCAGNEIISKPNIYKR